MKTTALQNLTERCRGISLGLFAADWGALRAAAEQSHGWGCELVHFDIMDGVFVPAMTGGPGIVKAMDTGQLRDVHLMVQNPARHVASYVQAGADMICVHAEATDAAAALGAIREAADKAARPVLAGLALMPGTPLTEVQSLLAMNPDMILVLSLDPRTGQPPDIATACARLAHLRKPGGPLLAFDGGVTLDSIGEIAACEPDIIVSGSAVFRAPEPQKAFMKMNEIWRTAGPTSLAAP